MIMDKNAQFMPETNKQTGGDYREGSNFLNKLIKRKRQFAFSLNPFLEAVLLPLIIPALLWILGSQDILLLETAFPWLIIIPIIIAARYGTWYALLSLSVFSVLSISYTIFYQSNLFDKNLQVLAGSLLAVIFVGEKLHYWKQKYNNISQKLLDDNQTRDKTEQELQLLHIGYSQLEERFVTTTQSLSKSLRLIELSLLPPLDSKQQFKQAIDKLNDILNEYTWLEESVFYYVDKNNKINSKPLASKNNFMKDLHNDILIQQAIKTKRTVRIKDCHSLENRAITQLKVAIPLVDSRKRLWGVMAVVRITPSVFQYQHLNLLNLLCAYIANLLSASLHPITSAERLFLETSTAINIVLNSVKSVSLIRITIPLSAEHSKYKEFFNNKINGISRIWQLQKKDGVVLVMLVPLFKESNAAAWQKKLENSFYKQFSVHIKEVNIELTIQNFQRKKSRRLSKNSD